MTFIPSAGRYQDMQYRRCGGHGLALPVISLGMWRNFGADRPYENSRKVALAAFDAGITHFDLASGYGPPEGGAETTFGRLIAADLRTHRDELIISTKAGNYMWPGPYGDGGTRKHVLASLDQSLRRLQVDYVDIMYSHSMDANTRVAETMGALITAVQQGKALYAGISNYSPEKTAEAAEILETAGVPLLVHQPPYSMLERKAEGLLNVLAEFGSGLVAYSPLAQGRLTTRYLDGTPAGSRGSRGELDMAWMTAENQERLRALGGVAAQRGQTLAQMALAWVLHDDRVTTALVGASTVAQLADNIDTIQHLEFASDELARIDEILQTTRG